MKTLAHLLTPLVVVLALSCGLSYAAHHEGGMSITVVMIRITQIICQIA